MSLTFVRLCALLLLQRTTVGLMYYYRLTRCVFNSTELADIRYVRSYIYNRVAFLTFDSSVGYFQGSTDVGVALAQKLNNDPGLLERARGEKQRYCACNINLDYPNILNQRVEPVAVLNSAPSAGRDKVLVCSVYGFFPKDISVSWTNHHEPITTGVTTTDVLPDADWHYQLHSTLEYSPRSGDQISCVIEHISLKEPMILDWEGALSDGDRIKTAIGASGLVLGLVLSLAGFIFYKHKSRGCFLVSRGS